MEYEKNGEGVLFVQTDKKNEMAPDYKGSVIIKDEEYFISGWKRVSKAGDKKFISISVGAKVVKEPAAAEVGTEDDGF